MAAIETRAIRIHEHGGPGVMRFESVTLDEPGPGQVLLRHDAVGVNFIDVYHRTGLYPVPLPATLGVEGAGVVEAVGEGVTDFAPGDRVAYATGAPGAYAERRLLAATLLVKVPDGVSTLEAAACLLQGMTVYVLTHRTFQVAAGQTVLWHAAAGGVGLLACQWLSALGVTVVGTVSTAEKAAIARAHGCAHTIVYTQENFAERVKEITGGEGVPVVFDSVGKTTWEGSLDCLRPFGLMVSFGNASGPVPPVSIGQLASKGSLYVTRPALATYIAKRESLERAAGAVFDALQSGTIRMGEPHRHSLRNAADAHTALESRRTTGPTVLLP